MKAIVREIGEMKIHLKLDAKRVRKRQYKLNSLYKQKVKLEIDRMMEERIIEPTT